MKIEMKGINKSFGSNQVLKDAGFVLEDSEVHAGRESRYRIYLSGVKCAVRPDRGGEPLYGKGDHKTFWNL